MKLSSQICFLATTASLASAQFSNPVPGVIALPFERRIDKLGKRAGSVELTTGSAYFNYMVNVSIGTPPQPLTMSLDTGSSDMIVLPAASDLCVNEYKDACNGFNYFNSGKSSSFKKIASNFSSQFGFPEQGKGSGADGDVATDTFSINGAVVKTQQFALAKGKYTIAFSILGLGYAAGENQVHTTPPQPQYDNLPLSLAKQGATNLAAFSLWKDKADSHNGKLLFGGIDKDKISGNLKTLDTQHREGFPDIIAFDAIINGLRMKGDSSFTNGSTGSVSAVLDCGTADTILPDEWLAPIYKQFSVSYFTANDTAIVDCSLKSKSYTVEFIFQDLVISTPISQFVIQYSGRSYCNFGLLNAGKRHPLLGDNFLSNAYTVFDMTNNQISIGSRNFDSSKENIVAVDKKGVIGTGTGTNSGGELGSTGKPSGAATFGASNVLVFGLVGAALIMSML